MNKRASRQVKIGNKVIGGGAPVLVQSMLNVPSEDYEKNLEQTLALEKAGCEIVRMAVPNLEAVKVLGKLKENTSVPLVADIHFDYRIALEAAAAGIDKIRINPGNIGEDSRIKAVTDECRKRNIPFNSNAIYLIINL